MRSFSVFVLGAGLGLVACVTAQERPSEPMTPVAATASSATAAALVEVLPPPKPSLPPSIKPASAACKLSSAGEASTLLFLPNRTKPFASLTGVAFEVALPSEGEPVIDASSPGLRLRAQGRLAQISLHLKRPVVFGEAVIPSSAALLTLDAVNEETLTLSHETRLGDLRVYPGMLQGKVACKDVGLDTVSYASKGALPDTGPGKPAVLKEGELIAFHAREEGDVTLEVELPEPPKLSGKPGAYRVSEVLSRPKVSVLKTSKAQSFVLVEGVHSTLFGWVSSASLRPPPKPTAASAGMIGMLGLLGHGAGIASEEKPKKHLICKEEVPLLIEQESARMTLGTLAPGGCLEVRQPGKDFSQVALFKVGIHTLEESRLLVPSEQLEGCRAPTPEEAPRCEGLASDQTQDPFSGVLGGDPGFGLGGLGLRKNEEGIGTNAKPPSKTQPKKK